VANTKRSPNLAALVALLSLVLTATGCATLYRRSDVVQGVDAAAYANEFARAAEILETERSSLYREKDEVLYYLDIGMLLHYAGEHALSNRALAQAEEAIHALYTRSLSRAAASLVVNDNVLEYGGEDYEDIYVNVFKALNYIALGEPDSAFVEVRRVGEKLNLLEDKYARMATGYNESGESALSFLPGRTRFYNSALARLISLILYEHDGQLDDARIDLVKIEEAFSTQPSIYEFVAPPLSVAQRGDTQPLRILSFVGQSPIKDAETYRIRTDKDLLTVSRTNERSDDDFELSVDAIRWNGVPEGYHFKFELPYIKPRGTKVASVWIRVDDGEPSAILPIESLEKAAVATYTVKKPLLYLKTITRTIAKGLGAERAKREVEKSVENPLLELLAKIATDVAIDASEAADLRVSRYMPALALVGEIALPMGIHRVQIEYRDTAGNVLYRDTHDSVDVSDRNVNLLESIYLQ
jgi:uncharacterized protein